MYKHKPIKQVEQAICDYLNDALGTALSPTLNPGVLTGVVMHPMSICEAVTTLLPTATLMKKVEGTYNTWNFIIAPTVFAVYERMKGSNLLAISLYKSKKDGGEIKFTHTGVCFIPKLELLDKNSFILEYREEAKKAVLEFNLRLSDTNIPFEDAVLESDGLHRLVNHSENFKSRLISEYYLDLGMMRFKSCPVEL